MSDGKDPADKRTQRALRNLAKEKVKLPLETKEFTFDQRRLVTRLIGLVIVIGLPVAGIGFLAFKEMLPGSGPAAPPWNDPIGLITLVFGVVVPVALGVFFYFCFLAARPRPDEADHPWRFHADTNGLTVTRVGGVLQGEWSRWRYLGCDKIKGDEGNLVITALALALDGREIKVHLMYIAQGRSLMTAVLQNLRGWDGNQDGPAS